MKDNKKLKDGRDSSKISGKEVYEVAQLAKTIKKVVPKATMKQATAAVKKAVRVPEFHNVRKVVKPAAIMILRKAVKKSK